MSPNPASRSNRGKESLSCQSVMNTELHYRMIIQLRGSAKLKIYPAKVCQEPWNWLRKRWCSLKLTLIMSSNFASGSGSGVWAAAGGQAVTLAVGVLRVGDMTRGEVRPLTITPPTLPSFWRRRNNKIKVKRLGAYTKLTIKYLYKEKSCNGLSFSIIWSIKEV